MIRAVLDTNVIVSGLGWSGPPSRVVEAALHGRFVAVTSAPLLRELERTLAYPKLTKVVPDPALVVELVADAFELVEAAELEVLADEPDNRLLEAALGRAQYMVTGDVALLAIGSTRTCTSSPRDRSWRSSTQVSPSLGV